MDDRDSTEVLYDMFELEFPDEKIQKITNYSMEFIKNIRYKYDLFTKEE